MRGRERIDPSDVYTCWLHTRLYWRRLGVPFIDPRGLGAVESNPEGNSCLLSVGAPDSPVHHRTLSGARFPSKIGAVDRCSLRAIGAPDTVRCTPDSSVPPSDIKHQNHIQARTHDDVKGQQDIKQGKCNALTLLPLTH